MSEVIINYVVFQRFRSTDHKTHCSNAECHRTFVLGELVIRTANSPRKYYCLGCFYSEPRTVPRDNRIIIRDLPKPYSEVKQDVLVDLGNHILRLANIRNYY